LIKLLRLTCLSMQLSLEFYGRLSNMIFSSIFSSDLLPNNENLHFMQQSEPPNYCASHHGHSKTSTPPLCLSATRLIIFRTRSLSSFEAKRTRPNQRMMHSRRSVRTQWNVPVALQKDPTRRSCHKLLVFESRANRTKSNDDAFAKQWNVQVALKKDAHFCETPHLRVEFARRKTLQVVVVVLYYCTVVERETKENVMMGSPMKWVQ